jgi:Raf kinase inhibitor-like YbhB/YbcL family protein
MVIRGCFSLRRPVPAALVAGILAAAGLAIGPATATSPMALTSPAFSRGATIPDWAAYRGCAVSAVNRSPALAWRGAPARTKGFALTLFDPDAPTGHGFYHWLLFNIPAGVTHVKANAGDPASPAAVRGAVQGHSDFGSAGYGGPCPPPGARPHHYVFTVSALDIAKLPGLSAATTAPQLEAAMSGHVLARGVLVGRFGR